MSSPTNTNANQPAALRGQNYRDAIAHLLRRAGFGPTTAEIDTAVSQPLAATISQLVDYEKVVDNFVAPDLPLLDQRTGRIDVLGEWWLGRMMNTSRPLQEKMTLFWHGHFATANYKVNHPGLMYQQNQTFRQNALGRFDDLLTAMYKDPAMLIWLDGRVNTKLAPNENWGREVLELFSMGPGHYTEDDVHANARAFTGWILNHLDVPIYLPRLHDDSVKTLLGQTGNWGPDDAVRIIAAHPTTGPFLAGKLWNFFASDTPAPSTIEHLSSTYYSSGHSIREMMRQLFSMPAFFATDARLNHVKSPAEFITHSLRPLHGTSRPLTGYARALSFLGQELFNPPNVGGWSGGLTWINGGTMLSRFNVASRITGDVPGNTPQIDPLAILADANPDSVDGFVTYLADRVGVNLTPETRQALITYGGGSSESRYHLRRDPGESPAYSLNLETKVAGLLHLLLVSPEFQLA